LLAIDGLITNIIEKRGEGFSKAIISTLVINEIFIVAPKHTRKIYNLDLDLQIN
jgi:hypothetical protein